jgi:hypothetical protein
MSLTDLIGTIEISEQVRGGMEPADTATLRFDASGFHDAGGVGRAGQEPGTTDAPALAAMLKARFDADALRALLQQVVDLHAALAD